MSQLSAEEPAQRSQEKEPSNILQLVGEPHRQRPTSLSLRARSEDEQGWTVDIQIANAPVQCVISGYFFEHALRSFSKALRSLQWSGSEANLPSFDHELKVIVVRPHRSSAALCIKVVQRAQATTSPDSVNPDDDDAQVPALDSGFIRVDSGMLVSIAEQIEAFLRQSATSV